MKINCSILIGFVSNVENNVEYVNHNFSLYNVELMKYLHSKTLFFLLNIFLQVQMQLMGGYPALVGLLLLQSLVWLCLYLYSTS